VIRVDVFKHLHGDAAEPQNLVNINTSIASQVIAVCRSV
jgi:hypothetical protein